MKHHVPIDAPGRARPVASTANMYTLASVRLLSFWLTATCSSAVKAYTYAYRTCVKRSRVYTFIHSCGRGNGARATRRLPNVYGHAMFHPRPSPFSMFPSPAQLNARNKSRNGEGLGPRLVVLSLVPSPCGGGKNGLVSIVCACVVAPRFVGVRICTCTLRVMLAVTLRAHSRI